MSERGAGAYIILFIVIVLAVSLFLLSLGWWQRSSPAVISANASATAISRDSLGSLMISAAQGYGISMVSVGVLFVAFSLATTPIAITAIVVSYLHARIPNNNYIIVAENRSQIREMLPHVLEAGGKMENTKTRIIKGR